MDQFAEAFAATAEPRLCGLRREGGLKRGHARQYQLR